MCSLMMNVLLNHNSIQARPPPLSALVQSYAVEICITDNKKNNNKKLNQLVAAIYVLSTTPTDTFSALIFHQESHLFMIHTLL